MDWNDMHKTEVQAMINNMRHFRHIIVHRNEMLKKIESKILKGSDSS